MSIDDTLSKQAVKEILEWAKWGKIKANREMYYPQLAMYKAITKSSHRAPLVTADRACYIEAVIMATKDDVGNENLNDTLDNIVSGISRRHLASERGISLGAMNDNISNTLNYFAGSLTATDRLTPDAPRSILL